MKRATKEETDLVMTAACQRLWDLIRTLHDGFGVHGAAVVVGYRGMDALMIADESVRRALMAEGPLDEARSYVIQSPNGMRMRVRFDFLPDDGHDPTCN